MGRPLLALMFLGLFLATAMADNGASSLRSRILPDPIAPLVGEEPAPAPPEPESKSWTGEFKTIGRLVWHTVSSGLEALVGAVTPPSPEEVARQIERGDSELWSLLDAAGYGLERIHTSMGLIPSVTVGFRLERELSAADREALEEDLERYADQAGGISARLQRWVIYTLLESFESGGRGIERVEIQLWPLPKAEFTLSPSNGGKVRPPPTR
jgi:hypothetical protein